jgi:NAD(P)-dependent dehydrogenase (short-subunit alcohol dehydrogenase family)
VSWTGRTALVTGASRGIGRAVAEALAARGARIAGVARDADLLRGLPEDVLPLVADVTDAEALAAVVGSALEAFDGRLDLLASVAGSSLGGARLEDLTDGDWRAAFELNLLAGARLQRLCFGALTAARGAIVHVGSVAATRAAVRGGAYGSAKAGLAALVRTTALEWARHGIRVNTVEPGFVDTEFNQQMRDAGLVDRFLDRVPTRRAVTAEAVARVVLFAGSPDNLDMTGSVLTVDGGLTARL